MSTHSATHHSSTSPSIGGVARDQAAPSNDKASLSEDALTRLDISRALREGFDDKSLAMFASETPGDEPWMARYFSRRNIAVAAGIVVLSIGGLVAFWMLNRGTGTPSGSGSLTITSEPSGSPVSIDGSSSGTTPLTIALNPGDHLVEVGAGAQARAQTLKINGGSNLMHVALAALPAAAPSTGGGLQIATEPAGARVWIDGEARGVSPLTISNVAAGEHAVVVRGASGDAINRTVSVRENAMASLFVSMHATPGVSSGWLAVRSPIPLQIVENGALVGSTETRRILLPAGPHELEFVNSALGYRAGRSVRITPGQDTAFDLTPPKGTLSINALPWAEVWIDGQRIGDTPIGNLSIAIGQHEVLFRHPELGEQRKSVIVGAQAPARIGVDLKTP